MSIWRFLVINGVLFQSSDVPPISSILESHPGAYTTSRTHNNASFLLFWERHLQRLVNSARILSESKPKFLFGREDEVSCTPLLASYSSWKSVIQPRVNDSLKALLPIALKERNSGDELAVTTLVSGNSSYLDVNEGDAEKERVFRALDVYLHIGVYVPPVFGTKENAARLAVVGRGRDVARAKFAEWANQRKRLENLKPPLVNEVLLSNNGDQILEGSVTNFFVVCRKDHSSNTDGRFAYEVQTASINDGVLPGVVRQLVIEVCTTSGIPIREVAPSWSQREFWEEAFITNSLRLVQHVESIQVPSSLELKTWSDVSWEKKHFEEGPGIITTKIQKEILGIAAVEGSSVSDFTL